MNRFSATFHILQNRFSVIIKLEEAGLFLEVTLVEVDYT
jgi:hypothetical protein